MLMRFMRYARRSAMPVESLILGFKVVHVLLDSVEWPVIEHTKILIVIERVEHCLRLEIFWRGRCQSRHGQLLRSCTLLGVGVVILRAVLDPFRRFPRCLFRFRRRFLCASLCCVVRPTRFTRQWWWSNSVYKHPRIGRSRRILRSQRVQLESAKGYLCIAPTLRLGSLCNCYFVQTIVNSLQLMTLTISQYPSPSYSRGLPVYYAIAESSLQPPSPLHSLDQSCPHKTAKFPPQDQNLLLLTSPRKTCTPCAESAEVSVVPVAQPPSNAFSVSNRG
jgi:hypothetical protein